MYRLLATELFTRTALRKGVCYHLEPLTVHSLYVKHGPDDVWCGCYSSLLQLLSQSADDCDSL